MIGWSKFVRLALLLGILFLTSSVAFAATIYTNSSTGNDSTGTGQSESPYATFYKAYTVASDGDTLNLTGTFDWNNSGELGDAATTGFTLSKNLTIQGQSADATIIQATSTDNTATKRVFTVAASTTVTIKDVTIRYGKAGTSQYGGGIDVVGNATIDSCDISYNRANDGGGGGVNVWGSATIQNSTIHHNVASYMGGGLNRHYYTANNGTPTGTSTMNIINSTISSNTVTQTVAYLEGGGVFYRRGEGAITNSTITLNQVTNGGSSRSTHGLGTGDGAGQIQLKNNIIAGNVLGTQGGDIGHRENGYGTYADNGANIIGRLGFYSSGYASSSSSWIDAIRYNYTTDGTYVYQTGTATTGTLSLDSALAANGSLNGTQTFAITSASSISVDNGLTGSNGATSTVPSLDQRELARVGTTDIGAYEYGASSDSTAPVISAIATSTATTTATITWTTDEAASTKVNFGIIALDYSTSTTETDTDTRVTSHSASLASLTACTRYHYQLQSTDASSNTATSSEYTLWTTGCTGSATVATTTAGTITIAAGGTLSQGNLTLTVPTAFTTATSSAVFQANQLDPTSFFATAGVPTGRERAGDTVFNLKAFTDATTTLSSFNSSLTVTLAYTDADVVGLDESSLLIYRYDGSAWSALTNCSLDTVAQTVTCSTTAFSDFAIFGTAAASAANTVGGSIGTSIQTQVGNLRQMGNNVAADQLVREWPQLFPPVVPAVSVEIKGAGGSSFNFSRSLGVGDSGDDVKALQEFLIKSDTGPIARELKRVGATGYFGSYTKNAVGEFQQAVNILPYRGFFGPITRAYLNNI